MNTASSVRDRDLADLVRDLDLLIELFSDAQPDDDDVVRFRTRDRDVTLKVLQHAAEALHEIRCMGGEP